VLDEYPSYDIFIDRETESAGYLLGNLAAAKAEIAPLHLNDRRNESL
jgi:hypothetical protein